MIKPGDMVTCGPVRGGALGLWLFDKPPDQQFKIHVGNLKRKEHGLVIVVLDTWSTTGEKRNAHMAFIIAHDGVGWCEATRLEVV